MRRELGVVHRLWTVILEYSLHLGKHRGQLSYNLSRERECRVLIQVDTVHNSKESNTGIQHMLSKPLPIDLTTKIPTM